MLIDRRGTEEEQEFREGYKMLTKTFVSLNKSRAPR